jgi:hypothetical protein
MKLLACFGGCLILSERLLSAGEPGNNFGPADLFARYPPRAWLTWLDIADKICCKFEAFG